MGMGAGEAPSLPLPHARVPRPPLEHCARAAVSLELSDPSELSPIRFLSKSLGQTQDKTDIFPKAAMLSIPPQMSF